MRKTDTIVDMMPDVNFDEVLSQFNTVLAANKILQKAQETGKPLNEISVVREGGKTRCVTDKEKKQSNSLKRKQLLEKLRNRTFRQECELAKDISDRIRRCQFLIKALNKLSTISDKEIVSMRRKLESIHNRSASLIKELRILENAIKRKKQEDPVIREVDEANEALLKAIKSKDTEKIRELKSFCKAKMEDYNLRKKRLIPYLAKAREARLKFILEKRRLIRIQFELYSQYMDKAAAEVSEGSLKGLDELKIQKLTDKINELRTMRSHARESIELLGRSLGNVALSFLNDVESEVKAVEQNHIIKMDNAIDVLISLNQNLQIEGSRTEESTEQISNNRMVFQERNKND